MNTEIPQFVNHPFSDIKEMTLTANQEKSAWEAKRLKWKTEHAQTSTDSHANEDISS